MLFDRKGDWIQVASGGRVYPLDPRPEEIRLEDIAHALSNICRFVGHVRDYYSVAQHSVLVSRFGPQNRMGLWHLLHDAPEAYMGDISRPLKRDLYSIEPKKALHATRADAKHVGCHEAMLMEAVAVALDLPPRPNWQDIHAADNIALATEARDLMAPLDPEWEKWLGGITPLPGRIEPLPPKEARRLFLERFHELNGVTA